MVTELYENGDAKRPLALPDFFTNQFALDYQEHLRNLVSGAE
jgi:hypothetical protein